MGGEAGRKEFKMQTKKEMETISFLVPAVAVMVSIPMCVIGCVQRGLGRRIRHVEERVQLMEEGRAAAAALPPAGFLGGVSFGPTQSPPVYVRYPPQVTVAAPAPTPSAPPEAPYFRPPPSAPPAYPPARYV